MRPDHVAVIDVGKTNAKLALVDTSQLSEIAVVTRPNTVLTAPPYPHFDVDGIWEFLTDALTGFHARYGIDAVSMTTHGAAGALIGADGHLAAPILDYEHTGPDALKADYDGIRPGFEETGSPRLPGGLNLGAQIHWQFSQDPTLRDRTKSIVTYPQYWGHRLTAVLASDVSSLGCHTDLWNPFEGCFSSLVDRLGIADIMAPARKSASLLGPLLPEIVNQTGLREGTPVFCGIHDSNASLLPHVLRERPPFSVISTGTWVIVMTMGGMRVALDPARDTLVNVNAFGTPVPSARFMGGREFEIISGGDNPPCDDATLVHVARHGPMLLPSVVPESGPFQGRVHRWVGPEPAQGSPERTAALGFYLAMMTAECLSMTGHCGTVVIEGPFSANTAFSSMLSAATGCPILLAGGSTGTSQGAAILSQGPDDLSGNPEEFSISHLEIALLAAYANRWRMAAAS